MRKTKGYLLLFLAMLKIGVFTFGGGYAMIALLENEFVAKKKWLEKDEFLDVAAVAGTVLVKIKSLSKNLHTLLLPNAFQCV